MDFSTNSVVEETEVYINHILFGQFCCKISNFHSIKISIFILNLVHKRKINFEFNFSGMAESNNGWMIEVLKVKFMNQHKM